MKLGEFMANLSRIGPRSFGVGFQVARRMLSTGSHVDISVNRVADTIFSPGVLKRPLSTVPKRFYTIDIPSYEDNSLEKVAEILNVAKSDQLQSQVFEVVFNRLQEKDWSLLGKFGRVLSQLRDSRGRTFLMRAVMNGDKEAVEQLIRYKIAIQKVDENRNTLLHIAAENGVLVDLPILFEFYDINAVNRLGQTPLHTAIFARQTRVVELLVSKFDNIDLAQCQYQNIRLSALPLAVLLGEIKCVDVLIKSPHRDFKEMIPGIGTLLHIAIKFGQIDTLKHLFQKYPAKMKELLEIKNEEKLTPFSLAAKEGQIEALILLKAQGANIEAKDDLERLPLHHAVEGEQLEVIPWLLHLGCKLRKVDRSGLSPLALAEQLAAASPENDLAISIVHKLRTTAYEKKPLVVASYDNLVFEGGGAKGIAHLGGLKYLDERKVLGSIKRVAGTSAGSITAAFIAVGRDVTQIEKDLAEAPMKSFLDHPLSSKRLEEAYGSNKAIQMLHLAYKSLNKMLKPMEIMQDLWKSTGICEGGEILHWFEKIMLDATGIHNLTFRELRERVNSNQGKHLHIFAIKLGELREIVRFSSEDKTWDDLIVAHALRASTSIPGVYKPHVLFFKNKQGHIYSVPNLGSYVDGGMLYNMPIDAFDERSYQKIGLSSENEKRSVKFNRHTLGFMLKTISKEVKPLETKPVKTVGELLICFKDIYFNAEELIRGNNPNNNDRIVELEIPPEVKTLSLDLTQEKQQALIKAAYEKTKQRLEDKLKVVNDSFFFNFAESKEK